MSTAVLEAWHEVLQQRDTKPLDLKVVKASGSGGAGRMWSLAWHLTNLILALGQPRSEQARRTGVHTKVRAL